MLKTLMLESASNAEDNGMAKIKQGLQTDLWKSNGTKASYFSHGPPDATLQAYHVRDELCPVDKTQLKEMQVCYRYNYYAVCQCALTHVKFVRENSVFKLALFGA